MSNKNVLFSSETGKQVFSVNLVGNSHQSAQEYILYEETDKTWLWNWADRRGKPYRTHKASSTHTKVFHSADEATKAIHDYILARIAEKEQALAAARADLDNFLDARRTYYSNPMYQTDVLECSRIEMAKAQQQQKEETADGQ